MAAPEGNLELRWSLQDNLIVIEWNERGVKLIGEPTRVGFGSHATKAAVAREPDNRTQLQCEEDGLRCRFEFRGSRLSS